MGQMDTRYYTPDRGGAVFLISLFANRVREVTGIKNDVLRSLLTSSKVY